MIPRRYKVPATATVDGPIAKLVGGGEAYWRVTVRTAPHWPHPPAFRVYTIVAFSDNLAAMEGLRRFGEELDPPVL
jgi:hypothetical protein